MKLSYKIPMVIGSLMGFLAVALGAFGAHGLKSILLENNHISTYELAVDYQFYHALGLLAIGLINRHENRQTFHVALWSFAFGILIFCGSLYTLAITNIHWLGAITPIGGALFLVGWGALALGCAQIKKAF